MDWAKWTLFVLSAFSLGHAVWTACYGEQKAEEKNTPKDKMMSFVVLAASATLLYFAGAFPWGPHA